MPGGIQIQSRPKGLQEQLTQQKHSYDRAIHVAEQTVKYQITETPERIDVNMILFRLPDTGCQVAWGRWCGIVIMRRILTDTPSL